MSDPMIYERCLYCLGEPDHKHVPTSSCGDCCAMHGELATYKHLYVWVDAIIKAHNIALKEAEAKVAELQYQLGKYPIHGPVTISVVDAALKLVRAEEKVAEQAATIERLRVEVGPELMCAANITDYCNCWRCVADAALSKQETK